MVFKTLFVLVLWTKVASALEELKISLKFVIGINDTFDYYFEIGNDFTMAEKTVKIDFKIL